MSKKKKAKNIKKTLFFMFFYFILFIIAFFLFEPKNLFNKNNSKNTAILNKLTKDDKLEEFKFIINLLENDYPYLNINKKYSGVDLSLKKEEYEKRIVETTDDISYEKTLSAFFEEFNQPNLFLLNFKDYYIYKKNAEVDRNSPWYKVINSKISTSRYREYKDISKEINESSGLVMDILLENKIAYIKVEDFNSLAIKRPTLIANFIDGISNYPYLIIDIRNNQGSSIEYVLSNIINPLVYSTFVMNSVILEKNENYSEFLDHYDNLPNISINEEFYKSSSLEIEDISKEDIENFPLYRSYNVRFDRNPEVLFNGKIYILQDKNTSNAGDFLSQFSNITNFANTVGQFTGGNGVNLNTPLIKLPKSGFILSMPIGMGINEEGSINTEFGTYPEIKVDENSDTLDKVLEMLN